MFCPKCGASNPEGSTFCGGCGAPLSPTPAAGAPQTGLPQQRVAAPNYAPAQVQPVGTGFGMSQFSFGNRAPKTPPIDGAYRADAEYWKQRSHRKACIHTTVGLYLLSGSLYATFGSSLVGWYWVATILFWVAFAGIFFFDLTQCWPRHHAISPIWDFNEYHKERMWYVILVGAAAVFLLIDRILIDTMIASIGNSSSSSSSSLNALSSGFSTSSIMSSIGTFTAIVILNLVFLGLLISAIAIRRERKLSGYSARNIFEYIAAAMGALVFLFLCLDWAGSSGVSFGALMSTVSLMAASGNLAFGFCMFAWLASLVLVIVAVVLLAHGKGRKRFTVSYIAFGLSAVTALVFIIGLSGLGGSSGAAATAFPWLVMFISLGALVLTFFAFASSRMGGGTAFRTATYQQPPIR